MGFFKGMLSIGSLVSPVPVIFRPTTTRERSRMYQRQQIRATQETNRLLSQGNQPVAGGAAWAPPTVPLQQEPNTYPLQQESKSVIKTPQRSEGISIQAFRDTLRSRADGVQKARAEEQDQALSDLDGHLDLIVRLAALKDQGHLSQEEFDEQKSRLLSR